MAWPAYASFEALITSWISSLNFSLFIKGPKTYSEARSETSFELPRPQQGVIPQRLRGLSTTTTARFHAYTLIISLHV